MKAVILAGGEGTRLRPLTLNAPKPMLPLVNEPMMEHIVRLLRQHDFDEIVVTVAFMANHIRTYFGDGSEFGVRMSYATEETPLGTAGSVRNAMDELDERFLVISGDVLTDIDLSEVVTAHVARGALATIGLTAVENPLEFGIVITNEDGSIERFLEKPGWGQVFSDTVNNGIFVLEPEIFDHIPEGRSVDFSGEVFPALLEAGARLDGHVCAGYWEDVGTLEAYMSAHRDVLDGRADVERSVIHDTSYLGKGARLRGTVIGRSADLRAGVRCEDGVVVGDECFIGEQAVLTSAVKIYPSKTVDAGAVVNASLVWETRGARSLFRPEGVVGLANVDITPELASRVAMA